MFFKWLLQCIDFDKSQFSYIWKLCLKKEYRKRKFILDKNLSNTIYDVYLPSYFNIYFQVKKFYLSKYKMNFDNSELDLLLSLMVGEYDLLYGNQQVKPLINLEDYCDGINNFLNINDTYKKEFYCDSNLEYIKKHEFLIEVMGKIDNDFKEFYIFLKEKDKEDLSLLFDFFSEYQDSLFEIASMNSIQNLFKCTYFATSNVDPLIFKNDVISLLFMEWHDEFYSLTMERSDEFYNLIIEQEPNASEKFLELYNLYQLYDVLAYKYKLLSTFLIRDDELPDTKGVEIYAKERKNSLLLDKNIFYFYLNSNEIIDSNKLVSDILNNLGRSKKVAGGIEDYDYLIEIDKNLIKQKDLFIKNKVSLKEYLTYSIDELRIVNNSVKIGTLDLKNMFNFSHIQPNIKYLVGLFVWDLAHQYNLSVYKVIELINGLLHKNDDELQKKGATYNLKSKQNDELNSRLSKVESIIENFLFMFPCGITKNQIKNYYRTTVQCISKGTFIDTLASGNKNKYDIQTNSFKHSNELNFNYDNFEILKLFDNEVENIEQYIDKQKNTLSDELYEEALIFYACNGHILSLKILFLNLLYKCNNEVISTYCNLNKINFKFFNTKIKFDKLKKLLLLYINDNDFEATEFYKFLQENKFISKLK